MPRIGRRVAALTLLAALAACGCGKEGVNSVSGKVYLDGKPLSSGSVLFLDAQGNTVPTAIGPDGSYRVTGLAEGKARVSVVGHPGSPPGLRFPGRQMGPPEGHTKGQNPPRREVVIPARYKVPESSGLTCEVRRGDQGHDIKLSP